jgi:PAS domain S-box-containing protein
MRRERESREALAFALQSGRMGTWELNLHTGRLSCSKEMLDLWGVTEAEFLGERKALQRKVHPEDLAAMNEAINEAIRCGAIYEFSYRLQPSPGVERWVMSRGRCTYEPGSPEPTRFSGVVFDITEAKAKEKALAAAVVAREQFMAIVSHELRTPLTSLQLQIQLRQLQLREGKTEHFTPDALEPWLRLQEQSVRRITRLVDDILDVSRITDGRLSIRLELFDLCEMASEALAGFQAIEREPPLEIRADLRGPIEGRWDRFRLEQVLLNLLNNAARYGGRSPIFVSAFREGSFAFLVVRDQGTGVRPEDQERIFGRFERAVSEKEVSGLGLGLYISREIIQAHGGEIRLTSKPGEGSEFTVALPLRG